VIYALAVGPSPDVLYAGTWGRGLYRSDDGGLTTWQATSRSVEEGEEDLTEALVRALAVTPDDETIYLSDWGNSVWRSKDHGANWEATVSFLPSHDSYNADVLLIDQDDSDIVYQATWGGVYKSTDGGNSWEHSDVAPDVEWEEKRVRVVIQADDGMLYAGTFGSGIYRSADGGQTWQAMGPQEPALACQVHSLVEWEGVVWAGTRNGVYRTMDGGQHWEQVITGFADDPRARRVQALARDNAGNLFAGTVDFGVYRSEDGGDTWRPYNDGLRGYALAILSLVYHEWDERVGILYATTYGAGIYRNAGDGWEPINGVGDGRLPAPAFKVQSLAFAGPDQGTLLAGTFLGGVYASSDRGQSWRRWPRALPIGAARNVADIVTLNDGQTIIVAGGTGLRRSKNGGENWKWAEVGLPEGGHRVISLAQGRQNPQLLFAALEQEDGVGIYHSTDGGETWQVRGQLADVDDLAFGGGGQTLFAVALGSGLFRSDDQGGSWQSLDKPFAPYSRQIVVNERSDWQRLILGFSRQSVHVRTLDGIYSSFDGGDTWQPSLGGQFETLQIDPVRSGVLYATTVTNTMVSTDATSARFTIAEESWMAVPTKVGGPLDTAQLAVQTIEVPSRELSMPLTATLHYTPSLWVSLNDGRSWERVSASDRSLTVLALDPLNRNRLLAGTPDNGVYYTTLDLPSPYTTGRALLGLAAFVVLPALILGTLLGLYLYFLLALQLRLYPWQVWALIIRIPAWRLVSTPRSELESLEQLIVSLAADLEAPFTTETLWNKLQSLGVAPSLIQIQNVLSGLQARRLFTRDRQGGYRFALTALARLAALHFDREALIEEVRSANFIARNAETFFDQAGFQVVPLLDRLFLWPESPHYRALGWLNAWLHIHQPLDEPAVAKLADSAGTGSRDLGFVILDHIPTPGAYRAMQAARLIPLGSSEIQRALDQRQAGLALERAVSKGQGQEDIFDLRDPLLDHLALFGRAELLDGWLTAIEGDQDIYFWGLPRSGRTSALWWLRTKVPGRWLRSYVDLRFRGPDWLPVLRDLLADLLLDLRRTHSRLATLPELDDALTACGPNLDLKAGLDYLAEQGLPVLSPRFVLFLDGAMPGAVLDRVQALAVRRDDVSLVVSWDGLPSDPAAVNGDGWLPPLTPREGHTLLETIGARLGLEFDDGDLDTLDRAAGGHPFLLRQLGSQIARMAGRLDAASTRQVLRPGEWPDPPSPQRVSAETAVQAYVQRQSHTLVRLWQALPPEVRRNVRLLEAGLPLDPTLEPAYTALGLLARDESGALRLRIGLLSRWLQERRP